METRSKLTPELKALILQFKSITGSNLKLWGRIGSEKWRDGLRIYLAKVHGYTVVNNILISVWIRNNPWILQPLRSHAETEPETSDSDTDFEIVPLLTPKSVDFRSSKHGRSTDQPKTGSLPAHMHKEMTAKTEKVTVCNSVTSDGQIATTNDAEKMNANGGESSLEIPKSTLSLNSLNEANVEEGVRGQQESAENGGQDPKSSLVDPGVGGVDELKMTPAEENSDSNIATEESNFGPLRRHLYLRRGNKDMQKNPEDTRRI